MPAIGRKEVLGLDLLLEDALEINFLMLDCRLQLLLIVLQCESF
jgi:hypothetical protein